MEDIGTGSELELSLEETDDDDDDEESPLRKKPRSSKSTSKSERFENKSGSSGRRAGRPPGSKNKAKNGSTKSSSAAGGHSIKQKISKSDLNKKTLKKNNIDDTENVNVPVVRENRVDLNDSTVIPESGCGSPVKENTQKASRKKLRKPETWYKIKKIQDKNFGRKYLSKNSKGEMIPRRARKLESPM